MSESYRDLIAWQKAKSLALEVYRDTRKFPKDEMYGLTSQMRRAQPCPSRATLPKEKGVIHIRSWSSSSIDPEELAPGT